MGLEFWVILEGFLLPKLVLLLLEQNDTSRIIAHGKKLSRGIKLNSVNYIFLFDMFDGLFISKGLMLDKIHMFGYFE